MAKVGEVLSEGLKYILGFIFLKRVHRSLPSIVQNMDDAEVAMTLIQVQQPHETDEGLGCTCGPAEMGLC